MIREDKIFKDNLFTIVEYGSDLGPKRALIIKDLLLKNGAEYMNISEIKEDHLPDYIISAKNLNIDCVNINEHFIEILLDRFVSTQWVTDCLKEKVLIDRKNYLIDIEGNIEVFIKSGRKLKSKSIFDKISTNKKKLCFSQKIEKISPGQEILNKIINDEKTEENDKRIIFPLKKLLNKRKFNPKEKIFHKMLEMDPHFKTIEEEKYDYSSLSQSINCSLLESDKKPRSTILNKEKESEQKNPIKLENEKLFESLITNKNLTNQDQDSLSYTQESTIQERESENLSQISFRDSDNEEITQSKIDSKKKFFEGFACSQGVKKHSDINLHITKKLEEMLEIHIKNKNIFQANAYRKAISIVKNYPLKIQFVDDLNNVKNLGIGIKGKIKEIILTGKMRKLEFLKENDERSNVIGLLSKVHGIGLANAEKLYKKGFRTIEELRKNQSDLNSIQKIGLKYFEDLQIKIPRSECEIILEEIKKELFKILPDTVADIVMCGSYRRGRELVGDIDILITRKDGGKIDGILDELIKNLTSSGLIIETLSLSKSSHENFVFMGICKINKSGLCRRIDIKIYNKKQFPFALLYFTGSAYFNRSMRLLARKLKFSLSDVGLEKVNRIKGERIPSGVNVECNSEEEIFAALGISYKTPAERDI